jgi:hypothetical protein
MHAKPRWGTFFFLDLMYVRMASLLKRLHNLKSQRTYFGSRKVNARTAAGLRRYGDAIAFFKHNDLPECASGRRLSGCGE